MAALLLAAGVGLTACGSLGPHAIRANRTDYNIALQQTEDQQLLLNVVRLRYGDRPLFLLNTSVTDSLRINPSLGIGASFPRLTSDTNPYKANAELSYSDGPTISYQPLQGKTFAQQVLGRIPLESVLLLAISDLNIERVLLTCIDSINQISNAPAAPGSFSSATEQYATFHRVAELLLAMQRQRLLWFHDHDNSGTREPYLVFDKQARALPEFQEFARTLRLDPALLEFRISTDRTKMGGDTISLRTRSFSGVLSFLSQAVEVPSADEAAGRAVMSLDELQRDIGWASRTEPLFRVRYTPSKPTDSAVSVRYRRGWFSIDDTDMQSKQTFSMLHQLFAMQADSGAQASPVLTLPVGG